MLDSLSRRDFIRRSAYVSFTALIARRAPSTPAHAIALRIGIVGDVDARHDGATLGVEEARHAAQLFGGTVTLVPLGAEEPIRGLTSVIGDANLSRCAALARDATRTSTIFLNVACTADAFRATTCGGNTFHVAPSDAMRRDAFAHGARTEQSGVVVGWDASLTRFGADTLNRRFVSRFGRAMAADAWAAWFAVKVLWESALRLSSTDPHAIVTYLVRDTTQFDGHKGVPLSFRSWDHQLRQPLYVRSKGGVDEIPTATKPNEAARALLDHLGVDSAAFSCNRVE